MQVQRTAGAVAVSAAAHLALLGLLRVPRPSPRVTPPQPHADQDRAPPIEVELVRAPSHAGERAAPAARLSTERPGDEGSARSPPRNGRRDEAPARDHDASSGEDVDPGHPEAPARDLEPAMSLATRPGAPSAGADAADGPAPAAFGLAAAARLVEPDPGPPPSFRPFEAMPWRRPKEPRSELRPSGGGTHRYEDATFTAHVGRDGRVRIEDKRTDLTELLTGNDPYYVRKLDFLDRTREERASIALAHRSEDLRQSIFELRGRLAEIWARTSYSPAERRRILFQLWDECAERGPAEVVEAAEQARATIEAFIRQTVPSGGSNGYSAQELKRLNSERTSKRRFAPYR